MLLIAGFMGHRYGKPVNVERAAYKLEEPMNTRKTKPGC